MAKRTCALESCGAEFEARARKIYCCQPCAFKAHLARQKDSRLLKLTLAPARRKRVPVDKSIPREPHQCPECRCTGRLAETWDQFTPEGRQRCGRYRCLNPDCKAPARATVAIRKVWSMGNRHWVEALSPIEPHDDKETLCTLQLCPCSSTSTTKTSPPTYCT